MEAYVDQRNPIWVTLPEDKVQRVMACVSPIVERKKTEEHHKLDGDSEEIRWATGKLGEAAFEHHFGLDFVDYSVGDSIAKDEPDLRPIGLNVGIKTVLLEHGHHIVHKDPKRPEVLIIVLSRRSSIILGFAPVWVLRSFQNSDNVLCQNILFSGKKTALDTKAYDNVQRFYSIEELRFITETDEIREGKKQPIREGIMP